MDVVLAKTFLTIVRTGSFVAAANYLNVSQTTVTARIKNLEKLLSCQLFNRIRSRVELTEHGLHFTSYAQQILDLWESSKRELPLLSSTDERLVIGCASSLWNPMISQWVAMIREKHPLLKLTIEVLDQTVLNKKVTEGLVDLAVVHLPAYSSEVYVEHILDEKLIMVSSLGNDPSYVFVDWGSEFQEQHDTALPMLSTDTLKFNLGPVALQYILNEGGRGYFRTRVVSRHLESGKLIKVEGMPEFSYPVFVLQRDRMNAIANDCLVSLRSVANSQADWF